MNRTFLIWWLLLDAAIVYSSKDIRKCNTAKVFSDEPCPASSMCTEKQTGSTDGVCICKDESLTFNPNYENDSDYCTLQLTNGGDGNSNTNTNSNSNSKSNSNLDIESNDRSDNKKYENENNKNDHIKTNDDNKQQISPLPGAKHVAAGIFFPIISVIILIGGIFAYKKLHITQHIRNFRRNRRSRPFYGDVSLEENSQGAARNVYYVEDTEQLPA